LSRVDRRRQSSHNAVVSLLEVVILLAVACAALIAGRALRVPPIAAYLVGGVLAGPGGLGLVSHSEGAEQLAELGVALLLFGVGTEISLERLADGIARTLAGGAAQVLGTIVLATSLFVALEAAWPAPLVIGKLV
jgi:monovalent cation:H+ antiporter-2, CPA2 family